MPKYYIKSGEIQFIISREDFHEAIIDCLKYYESKKYKTGPKICISEIGFDSFKLWKCYETDLYIKKLKEHDGNK